MLGNFSCFFLPSAYIFQHYIFQNHFSGIKSVSNSLDPDQSWHSVQTVCKGYQQATLARSVKSKSICDTSWSSILDLHLRDLLAHTLLFRHFLENFWIKNTLEYIRTLLSGNTWLFPEITDLEHSRNWGWVENFKKRKSQIYHYSSKSIRKTV